MIEIIDQKKCSGCTACVSACPKKCISMIANKEGFLYPEVNNKECVVCGICLKVCPIDNKSKNQFEKQSVILRSRDEDILENSASGGFVTPVSEYIIDKGGVVFAAGLTDTFEVKHLLIDTKDMVRSIRGSKYVQSDLTDMFVKAKEMLERGRQILFCGTPCQIQGLYNYLGGREHDNLFLIDFVCKGVASPAYWKKYLEYHENENKSRIKHINFRKKNRGYHSSDMEIVFENEKIYAKSKQDLFLRAYINNICMRESCYHCQFKGINRCSDFTIFDAWSAEKITKAIKDDDKGYTNVVIHTQKGRKLLKELQGSYYMYESELAKAIKYDGIMVDKATSYNINRQEFFECVGQEGIKAAIQTYLPINKIDIVVDVLKEILYKMGLLQLCKKIKRELLSCLGLRK